MGALRHLPWILVPAAAWLGYRPAAAPTPETAPAPPPSQARVLGDTLSSEDAATLLKRLESAVTATSSGDAHLQRTLLCARLAEVDPVAALDWLKANETGSSWQLRAMILTEWALRDSEAAWDWLGNDDLRVEIAGHLLGEDPDLFMEWFRKLGGKPWPNGEAAWMRVMDRHSKELAEFASAALADTTSDKWALTRFHEMLAVHRSEKDASGAWTWAQSLPKEIRTRVLLATIDAWSENDPAAARKALLAIDPEILTEMDQYYTAGHGRSLLRKISGDDPAAALQLLRDLPTGISDLTSLGMPLMREVARDAIQEGRLSGIEAFRVLNSAKGSDSNLPLNVLDRMWFGLSRDTLESTAAALLKEPSDHMRRVALEGVSAAWFKQDPEGALAFISAIEDPGLRREMLRGSVNQATGGMMDPTSRVDLLKQLPETDRAAVIASTNSRYGDPQPGPSYIGSEQLPPRDTAALLEGLPASPDLNRAIRQAAMKWGEEDPASAISWAAGLPDPSARAEAYGALMDGWSYHDPVSAAEWVTGQPPGADRDAAILPLLRRMDDLDPAAAWQWTSSIGDGDTRNSARVEVMKAWMKSSRADAESAAATYRSTLPPAEAADFARKISGR